MKFCTSIDQFCKEYSRYQTIFGTKPVLEEKQRCVVASHAPEIAVSGHVFALPFSFIEPDARKNGFDVSTWN